MLAACAWATVPHIVITFRSFISKYLIAWRTIASPSCEDIPHRPSLPLLSWLARTTLCSAPQPGCRSFPRCDPSFSAILPGVTRLPRLYYLLAVISHAKECSGRFHMASILKGRYANTSCTVEARTQRELCG
jgi:hypothetical protein